MKRNRKKKHFTILIIAAVLALCGVIAVLLYSQNGTVTETSAERLPDRYDGTITAYTSTVDKDGDGIDDQTDILESAIAYVNLST